MGKFHFFIFLASECPVVPALCIERIVHPSFDKDFYFYTPAMPLSHRTKLTRILMSSISKMSFNHRFIDIRTHQVHTLHLVTMSLESLIL